MNTVLVIGASPNPLRYSYLAVKLLLEYNYKVFCIGKKNGSIDECQIHHELIPLVEIDSVLFYLSPEKQKEYFEYIIEIKPRRVIFNPGTENHEFARFLKQNGIEVVYGCSVIMLNSGLF